MNGATLPRRFGHRRSSSLPVPPANNETKLRKGKENPDKQNGKEDGMWKHCYNVKPLCPFSQKCSVVIFVYACRTCDHRVTFMRKKYFSTKFYNENLEWSMIHVMLANTCSGS